MSFSFFGSTQPPQAPSNVPQVPNAPQWWDSVASWFSGGSSSAPQSQDPSEAIAADQAATFAVARALTSAKLRAASAKADQAAASSAISAMREFPPSDARNTAAQSGLSSTMAKAQANQRDVYSSMLVAGWKYVLNKLQSSAAKTAVGRRTEMSHGTGLDCFGCDEIGFDMSSIGPLFQAAGGMASGAISDYEADEKKKAASADDKKKADAAFSADQTAAMAAAKAKASATLKQPSAQIDATAAAQSISASVKASAGLSAAALALRAKADNDALNDAIKKAQASPKDVYAQALVEAWTTITNMSNSGNIVAQGAARDQPSSPSWWSRLSTPAKVGVGVGGAGAVGALGWVAKKFLFK